MRNNGNGGRSSTASQEASRGASGSRSGFSILRTIAALGLTAGVVVLLAWLLSLLGTVVVTVPVLLFVALMGVFPISYITYVGFGREDAHRERLKNDFRLLGLASEDTLDETVSKLYQVVYNRWQYVAYITLITLVALLVFGGYLRQDSLPQFLLGNNILTQETMQLLFYAFLGAYVFTVQATVRRYNTLDLQPQVYSSMLVRILVALAIVFAGVKLIQAAGGSLVETTAGTEGADAAAWATVLAFVVGAFPTVGFRWLLNLASKTFTLPAVQSSERPLTYLIGMSTWHEARLQEIGIDDAQNLATADIRKLLLTTRFDTQTIVNWIDQAILYTRIGPKIDRFRDAHIETFFQFRQQLDEIGGADGEEQRRLMAVALGLADDEMLQRVANSDNFPNYTHIVEYYSRVGDVVRERAKEGMSNVLGRVFRYDTVESVERAEEWLRTHPREVQMRLALGKAYYQLGNRERAEACYREAATTSEDPALQADAFASLSALAIDDEEYETAIAEATRAIQKYPYSTAAHNNRGLAYLLAGYPGQALDDLNRALALDDRYADAYFNRGRLLLKEGESQQAAHNFYHAYLLGDRQNPALWHYWGEALFDPDSKEAVAAAVEKFTEAIRRADRAREDHANIRLWAYVRRGYAHTRQDEFEAAEADLLLVTNEADADQPQQREILVVAYIYRGLLDAARKRHEGAVNCYLQAIELDPTSVAAYHNLAVTYHRMQKMDDARAAFQRLLELAEPDSPERREALRWLLRNAPEEPAAAASGADNGRPTTDGPVTGDGPSPPSRDQPPPVSPPPGDEPPPADGPIA
jgi:tetratricopeptide (TPR) repeat protein